MTLPTIPLGEVAPAKPINLKMGVDTPVWQITLDHIEADTGKLLTRQIKPLGDAGASTHGFDERHVLYSKLRPYLNKVLLPDRQGIGTTELVPMLPDPERLDRSYLAHYLMTKRFVTWIAEHSSGAKMPRATMADFWAHEIPLPPLPEQKRIAAILDKADAIRRKRQQAFQLADQFLRSVFLDLFGDPVTNPKGWVKVSIQDLVERVIDCPHSTPKWTQSGKVAIRTSNLTAGGWNWDDKRYVSEAEFIQRSSRAFVKPGDVVLSREGTVGVAAIVQEGMEICLGQRLVHLQPDPNKAISEYLLYILLYELAPERISRVMVGATSKHLNVGELKKMMIPKPPMQLQRRFKEAVTRTERMKVYLLTMSANSADLFGVLSQHAFSGDL